MRLDVTSATPVTEDGQTEQNVGSYLILRGYGLQFWTYVAKMDVLKIVGLRLETNEFSGLSWRDEH